MKRTRRGGRKRKERRMKYLQKLEAEKMLLEMGIVKPQICNDNLKDNQCNESKVENIEEEILDASNNPHLYNSSLKEEKYKNVNMKENSLEEIASTENMSIANNQNQLASLSESAKEQPLQKTEIRNGITRQTASPLCDELLSITTYKVYLKGDILLGFPIKKTEAYTNLTDLATKEQLTHILSASSNSINMYTKNILPPYEIVSATVPDNSFSNVPSSISPDNLKANNTHQTEDPTGSNRQPPLLPPSCGHHSSSDVIQTTSSVSSVSASFPSITQTTSSVSSVSAPFPVLKSSDNMKIDSSININKETCSLTVSKDTLQNCVAKQLSKNTCKKYSLNLDCSMSDEIFSQLVEVELQKIPEPEKLKRKQAIMNILWQPL